MKRAIFSIFLVVAVLLLISAHETPLLKNTDTYTAPKFTIGEGDSAVSLDDMRGKYVLLTFWSSDDARSRLANIENSAIADQHASLEHVGVNFDNSRSMFKEILKRDHLTESPLQLHVDGESASRLISSYGLKNGYQSYLVGPDGNVLARNPSAETITGHVTSAI